MGASSSSSGINPSPSISTKDDQVETFLHNMEDNHSTAINDNKKQRTYIASDNCDMKDESQSQLTCAAQMAGWQTVDDNHRQPMSQQNNRTEVMELLRIISQLAMANNQLANAHNAILTRIEALYGLELLEDKENRKRTISTEGLETFNDICRKGSQDVEQKVIEMKKMPRLEQRIRAENLSVDSFIRQCKQIDSQDNDTLNSERQRLEMQEMNNDKCSQTIKSCDISSGFLNNHEKCSSLERQITHTVIDAANKIFEDNGERQHVIKETADDDDCKSFNTCFDHIEMNVPKMDKDIQVYFTSGDLHSDEVRRRYVRLPDDGQNLIRNPSDEEIFKLSGDIEDLKNSQEDYGSASEGPLSTYENQEKVKEEKKENKREKDRISLSICLRSNKNATLEQDIQNFYVRESPKSLCEEEQIKNLDNERTVQVVYKEKQGKALGDVLEENQRLKETIKTERGNGNDVTAKEDIDTTDSISESASGYVENMREFKKELTLKREARQRGIAAITFEMERLRQELNAEKKAHCETFAMLALLRSSCDDPRNEDSKNTDMDNVNDDVKKPTLRDKREDKYPNENDQVSKREEAQRLTNTLKVSDELRNNMRYQIEKIDDLCYHLEIDPEHHQHRIRSLTELTNKARESLGTRERFTNQLKDHLAQVLVKLSDKSYLEVKDYTAAECNRQLDSLNMLKALYNGRLRILTELKDSAIKELTDVKQKLERSLKMSENMEEELKKAEEKIDVQDSEITNLESQLGLTKADCRDLQNQMSLINGLFTQMLLGASSADMNLDRLTQLLQENHDLISDIAKEESTEAAALPKLLLDLIEQVEGGKVSQKCTDESSMENSCEIEKKEDDLQEKDIAHNLPKVWRVLLELLSCHAASSPVVSIAADPNSCYKSVDTPTGPTLVISVSKTYIRLKELILEKKHLEKEMNRMKQLNGHLESKLGEQEKRLSMVSVELTKTWNIVGRMRAQHQQLHTHEQILRYELQQKRNMLQELKQELEYCKEKWESARQKNTNTELEWRNLRREFAARKALVVQDSFNNSGESGFSDERGDDTDEDEDTIEERIRYGSRRRTRKENAREPTPDTESEQPTDTELSESKSTFSMALEQRTSTPETEAELDDTELTNVCLESVNVTEHIAENVQEALNPLDEALSNVIQNLIRINDGELGSDTPALKKNTVMENSCDNLTSGSNENEKSQITISETDSSSKILSSNEPWYSLSTSKALKRASTSTDLSSAVDKEESIGSSSIIAGNCTKQFNNHGEIIKSETSSSVSHVTIATSTDTVSMMPVFSIGPYPTSTLTHSSTENVQFSDSLTVDSSNCSFALVFSAPTIELKNHKDNSIASVVCFSSVALPNQENKEKRPDKPTENITDSDSISIESSSSVETVRELFTTDVNSLSASTSASEDEQGEIAISSRRATDTSIKSRTPEEVLATRADRLKRLEEQADWLVKKMNATNKRGSDLCTRLEELHEVYGEPPLPPPMPDILPSCKLPSSISNLPHQMLESTSLVNNKNTEDKDPNSMKSDALQSNNES